VVQAAGNQQPDRTLNVDGPPVKAAFDANGNPTQAALGFAKKNGVDIGEIDRSGEKLRYSKQIAGAEAVTLLPGIVQAVAGRAADRQAHALGAPQGRVRAPDAVAGDAARQRGRALHILGQPPAMKVARPPLHGQQRNLHRQEPRQLPGRAGTPTKPRWKRCT
jgi:hypothetical protein